MLSDSRSFSATYLLYFLSSLFFVSFFFFFFFNDTATTEIYTLSLHDALPISLPAMSPGAAKRKTCQKGKFHGMTASTTRSEEHTSELQSQSNLVCRLLLEKKKKIILKSLSLIEQFQH